MSNTPNQNITLTITPSVANPVRHSPVTAFFANEIVPKQLTVENCQKGLLYTLDANGNAVAWSPIVYFPIIGSIN